MKKALETVLFTIVLICGCPFILSRMVNGQDGMALLFILLFMVNPIYSIMVGIAAGKDLFNCLYYPFIVAIVFVVGYMLIFDSYDKAFYIYGGVYFILSSLSMMITYLLEHKKQNS